MEPRNPVYIFPPGLDIDIENSEDLEGDHFVAVDTTIGILHYFAPIGYTGYPESL